MTPFSEIFVRIFVFSAVFLRYAGADGCGQRRFVASAVRKDAVSVRYAPSFSDAELSDRIPMLYTLSAMRRSNSTVAKTSPIARCASTCVMPKAFVSASKPKCLDSGIYLRARMMVSSSSLSKM